MISFTVSCAGVSLFETKKNQIWMWNLKVDRIRLYNVCIMCL